MKRSADGESGYPESSAAALLSPRNVKSNRPPQENVKEKDKDKDSKPKKAETRKKE